MQEKELIDQMVKGDERAFEAIFKGHYRSLCTYANSFLNDPPEAEELVQATFIALWEGRTKVDIHTSLKSYLYRSIHNGCINKLKHLKVREAYGKESLYTSSNADESTSNIVHGNELEEKIAIAIEILPPQCKVVFKLSRQEGLSYSEIAQNLGISVKAVDKQIVRALRILREELKDYLPAIMLFIIFKN